MASFPQEILSLLTITPKLAGWDADLATNRDKITQLIKTFQIINAVPGSTASPSRIEIRLRDADDADAGREAYLRVKVCDLDGYADATNATIAAAGGTTLVETVSAGKDLVFMSDNAGLFEIDLTNAVAETVTLRIGPAPLSPDFGSYRNTLEVAHA